MKKYNLLTKSLVIAVLSSLGNNLTYAQATATAGAYATVIVPVSLSKNVDMNFGNAAVSASAGGSVILAPAGTRSTTGGGVTLPAASGTVNAANFTVSGAPGYTFAITLPSSATITGPGSSTMTVSAFTSNPAATGTLGSGGTKTLAVGATLSIGAAQLPGTYTNVSALPVTVNYN